MKFDRAPSAALLASFDGGLLSAMRRPLHVVVEGERVPLDPHFREDEVVALYAGQTVVLTMRRGADGTFAATAHETYAKQPCADVLLRRWPAHDAAGFERALGAYLEAVQVGARWVQREGRVQLRWIGRDPSATGAPPWIPIDREVVLGHASATARAAARAGEGFAAALQAVSELALRKGWPAPPTRGDSNEVDQLAVDADGKRLFLVELKPRDASAVYYAPLQVLRYFVEWRRAWGGDRDAIVRSIRGVADARATAGFGPADVRVDDAAELVPVIAFNDPPTREAYARMLEVVSALRSFGDGEALAGLEIWAWPDGAGPRRMGAGDLPAERVVRRCGACGSEEVVPIVYGKPSSEILAMAARVEVALGGCLVGEAMPRWRCRACGRDAGGVA